jgi:hypothetical protein
VEREVRVSAAQVRDEVILEGADGAFGRIGAVKTSRSCRCGIRILTKNSHRDWRRMCVDVDEMLKVGGLRVRK